MCVCVCRDGDIGYFVTTNIYMYVHSRQGRKWYSPSMLGFGLNMMAAYLLRV